MNRDHALLQAGYILHTRPYRETSLLIDAFMREKGRISIIAKGVRQLKSRWRGLLQPFMPLYLSWYGRGELYTLTQAEMAAMPLSLSGQSLICGLYANELLVRLLHREDPHADMYDSYVDLLQILSQANTASSLQFALRIFEKRLLQGLGYAFSLIEDCQTLQPILPQAWYCFIPAQGMTQTPDKTLPTRISGETLLALHHEVLQVSHLREIKMLMRMAIASILGSQPLYCRELL